MTDTSPTPPAEQPKGLLQRIEGEIEDLVHGGETAVADAEPVVDEATKVAGDVVDAVDPAAAPVVDTVEGAEAVVAHAIPPRPGPVTVDSSVTQGNRVTTASQLDPENPVALLTAKIKGHFGEATAIVGDLKAAAAALEVELNKLATGL